MSVFVFFIKIKSFSNIIKSPGRAAHKIWFQIFSIIIDIDQYAFFFIDKLFFYIAQPYVQYSVRKFKPGLATCGFAANHERFYLFENRGEKK